MTVRKNLKALIAIAALAAHGAGRAQDESQDHASEWARFHVGIGIGSTSSALGFTVSEAGGIPGQIWTNNVAEVEDTVHKLVVGFRPVRIVGAEIQYVDFGDGDVTLARGLAGQAPPRQYAAMKAGADATLISALLFIPERSAMVDLYAKLGLADLSEEMRVSGYDADGPGCVPAIPNCAFDISVAKSGTVAYAGFGVSVKIGRTLGLRLEYEAIDTHSQGSTGLVSAIIGAEF